MAKLLMVNAAEVADILCKHQSTLWRYIDDGRLTAYRLGGHGPMRVLLSDFRRFLRQARPVRRRSVIPKGVYDPQEAAALLGVNPQYVWRWLRAGKLYGRRMGHKGSRWRIPSRALQTFLDESRVDTGR